MNEVSRSGAMSRVVAEGFDYQSEADKTCSIEWNPQHVDYDAFLKTLSQFVDLCGVLNVYKKLLFRGKTPADVGLPQPMYSDSLAAHGGAIPPTEIDLVHGIVGSATEVGELAEILLDLLEGKAADRVNAIEESGDIRWYLNRVLRWADCSDLQCEMTNIDKLHGRHGSSFDVFRDANRDLQRERVRLEVSVDRPRARCMGGRFCSHRPGECTADPAYQAAMKTERAPTLPLGPLGDEEAEHVERKPIGDVPGMDC